MAEAKAASGRLRILGPVDFVKAFPVSRETLEKLKIYAELVSRWQKAVNLVAPNTLDEIWHRHIADSAQLGPLVPSSTRSLADFGSGGGFPGMVLAILLPERASECKITLVESDQRKAAFLAEVARQTEVTVDILSGRIENPATHAKLRHVDVVTARALAPLGRLLDLLHPFFGPSTVGLLLKGREVAGEVTEAAMRWNFELNLQPSVTDAGGQIALISALGAKTEG